MLQHLMHWLVQRDRHNYQTSYMFPYMICKSGLAGCSPSGWLHSISGRVHCQVDVKMDDGDYLYSSISPDEVALVDIAKQVGLTLVGCDISVWLLTRQGYQILTIGCSNFRKCLAQLVLNNSETKSR